MRENTKLILFDIGAVLIEYGSVFKTVAEEQGFEHEFIDKTFDKYDHQITTGKITPQELYLSCLDEYNIIADRKYNFVKSWIKDYEPLKHTYALVEDLTHKYEVGYLSNIYKGLVEEMIAQEIIPNLKPKYRFLSCNIGLQKPKVELYEYVELNIRFKPNEIFFVDDKLENLKVAQSRGWETFEFTRFESEKNVEILRKLLL